MLSPTPTPEADTMRKPRIFRQQYNKPSAPTTLYEFSSDVGGGLIELIPTDDGRLIVDLYRLDDTVTVRAPEANLRPAATTGRKPERIDSRAQLIALASTLRVRHDWHEPDEQEVTATVDGTSFDNAGFWPADGRDVTTEQHVILAQGDARYAVNLATLFAWATGYEH